MRLSVSIVLAMTMAALAGPAAVAGTVTVSPTRLTIARSGTSADLGLTNAGTTPIRFSVRAFRWRQTLDGVVELTPTDELIVFPQILTIASQERRTVRVAFTGPLPATEADYRILASELPIADDASAPPGLTIRSKLSMPVFIVPSQAHHEVAIEEARATAGKMAFDLTERGSAHDFLKTVRIRGENAQGTTLFDHTFEGWYVLPAEPRRFEVPLPPSACRRLAHVTIDATFENLPDKHMRLVPTESC